MTTYYMVNELNHNNIII